MENLIKIGKYQIYLAKPEEIPDCKFVGRRQDLELCAVAWGIDPDTGEFLKDDQAPLHFRLQGPPGVGKNEIVYQLARLTKRPLYIIHGHEEMSPEDLSILLVPKAKSHEELENSTSGTSDGQRETLRSVDAIPNSSGAAQLTLRASPLATAIFNGGLVFFDEINRVPERALSPLSSVLDDRLCIYSAITGIRIGPNPNDKTAAKSFRFCCALNPAINDQIQGLPDYIEQRTLPVINIGYPEKEELLEIIEKNLKEATIKSSKATPKGSSIKDFCSAFDRWYERKLAQQNNKHKKDEVKEKLEISIRQAKSLVNLAMKLQAQKGGTAEENIAKVESYIVEK